LDQSVTPPKATSKRAARASSFLSISESTFKKVLSPQAKHVVAIAAYIVTGFYTFVRDGKATPASMNIGGTRPAELIDFLGAATVATVFLIGFRINRLLSVREWLAVVKAPTPMLRELYSNPSLGFLCAHTSVYWRRFIVIQFWRNFDDGVLCPIP
jgi:hypothetical protein